MHFIECFRCMLKRRLIGKQEGMMKQNGGMGRQLALGKWYRTTTTPIASLGKAAKAAVDCQALCL